MKSTGIYFILALIVLGSLSFLIFKPGVTGNVVAATGSGNSCNDNLLIADNNLKSAQAELATCNQLKTAAINDMSKLSTVPVCDKSDLEQKISTLTSQRTSIMKSLKEAQDAAKQCTGNEIADLNNTLNELGKNSANNICCKMRVDNPNIKAYNLDGNKVNCLESGGLTLSCP